jgi:hypothetical protein
MKTKHIELDVDFIGGMGTLTENEEKSLSEFLRKKKSTKPQKKVRTSLSNKKKEHA